MLNSSILSIPVTHPNIKFIHNLVLAYIYTYIYIYIYIYIYYIYIYIYTKIKQ